LTCLLIVYTRCILACSCHRPSGDPNKPLKALLFENWYDQFRGVVCLVNVLEGALKKGTSSPSAYGSLSLSLLRAWQPSLIIAHAHQETES
jgi:hypothetical protein